MSEPRDTPWRARLRRRQSRYRESVLKLDAGPMRPPKDGVTPRSVESMLPLEVLEPDFEGDGNFINDDVRAAVDDRLSMTSTAPAYWPRSIAIDRLKRNLLSSQPAAFNLFGNLVTSPDGLLPWVRRRIDPDAIGVTDIRIEWAPPPAEHLNNGTAFDAFARYETDGGVRFVAIECKYAENLAAGFKRSTAERYRSQIEGLGFLGGSFDELNTAGHQQFLLNVALAESLAQKCETQGHSVVIACRDDAAAEQATRFVAERLAAGHVDLIWSPFEELLDDLAPAPWITKFRERYLEDGS